MIRSFFATQISAVPFLLNCQSRALTVLFPSTVCLEFICLRNPFALPQSVVEAGVCVTIMASNLKPLDGSSARRSWNGVSAVAINVK
ncbi:hypothetical protein CEXT_82481 [Caerostris extrusa]|uniref:Secreted protein n=1 Tax=Caerostris extrusa TaxID=172846 RepID=A0AAV4PB36_CAEEX|nr:hypothetical protein CEXT_82481 [Caerostris extrusa]